MGVEGTSSRLIARVEAHLAAHDEHGAVGQDHAAGKGTRIRHRGKRLHVRRRSIRSDRDLHPGDRLAHDKARSARRQGITKSGPPLHDDDCVSFGGRHILLLQPGP